MEFKYTLEEVDYLQFQLFTASQSDRIKRRKRTGWIFLTTASALACIYFFKEQDQTMGTYFAVTTALIILLYPAYFRWKFKKHYIKFIRENYGSRVGSQEYIEFQDKHIFLKDKTGEGKVKHTEIECIYELAEHYFIKISNGNSVIIPKSVQNFIGLQRELAKLKVETFDFNQWQWR